MAGLVAVDHLKDPGHDRIGAHPPVGEQDFHLPESALLGQHDNSTELFEVIRTGGDGGGIKLVDLAAEHAQDEAVDVADIAPHRQRHPALPFEPAPEHVVELAFVGAVTLDLGDEGAVIRAALAHGGEHPAQRGVTPVFVVEVDRGQQIRVAVAKCVAGCAHRIVPVLCVAPV